MSSRTKKLLVAAGFLFGALFALPTSAQIVQQNIFHLNPASSTIVPNNASYTIPCAYISTPGCGSGGGSGGVINASSTATSTIANLNGMLSIPYNYATAGCFGSPTTTDLGGCINLGYSLLPSGGGQIDIPSIGVAPYTTPIVEGNQANAKPVMLYCSSGGGFYGGGTILYYTPNSGSALTVNNIGYSGGGYGITNCGFNGPAGIGNIGSSTIGSTIGVNLGGTGAQGTAGAFGFTMTGVHISGFGTCLYIGSNMSFMLFQDGAINKCGRDIDSPAVSGANGENMRIVNSTVADCNSPNGQSISAFCMDVQESGNVQWTLDGDSFDDAQIYSNQFGGTANIWNITDLHDEDPNTGQACYDRILTQPSAAGAQATVFNIKGGDMMEDITTGCPEFVSFGGKLVLDATTGDINNNVSVPDTVYANPLNNSTVLSWTGLSNQGFNTSNSANTGFTNVVGTTTGSAIDGLELGSSSPVYYATTSTFYCATCSSAGGGVASSSAPFSAGTIPVATGSGALTNSLISQSAIAGTSSIAYDAQSGWSINASVSTASQPITIGNGANRMLFVFTLTTSGTASTTSVTYNGATLTFVASTTADSGRTLALYDLPNPTSGTNNITVNTQQSEAVVQFGGVSYSGVLQSTSLDAATTTASSTSLTSLTTTLTTIASNDWSVNLTRFASGSNGNVGGASSTVRLISGNLNLSIQDTNGPKTPAGSQSMTVTNSNGSGGAYSIMAAFAPAPAVTTNTVNVNGNVSSTSFTAGSSTPSVIQNFDDTLYVPSPYSSSTFGDFGTYVTNWFNARVTAGDHAVSVVIPASGIPANMWTQEIVASSTGTSISISCSASALVNWTGAATSTYLNTGSQVNNTYGAQPFWGCNVDGNGRTGQIFVEAGGVSGAFRIDVEHANIFDFKRGVVMDSNAPFPIIANNSFQFVDQPILMNYAATTNSGENDAIQNNIFGSCENGTLASGANSSVAITNGAGVTLAANSFDDCTYYNGAGTSAEWVSGWVEDPGINATPYPKVFPITIATSTTSELKVDSFNALNDTSSTTSTPLGYFFDSGYLSINGGWVGANGSASSVPMLVLTGPNAYAQVCNLLNGQPGTNIGVSSIINAGYNLIQSTAGSGQQCVTVNNNSYAYSEYTSGSNVHTWYFGTAPAMSLTTGLGGNGADDGLSIGNLGGTTVPQATSTVDDQNTLGLSSSQFTSTTTIQSVSNGSTFLYTFTGSTANTPINLPTATSTQNRTYGFTNAGSVTFVVNAVSTNHIFATSSVTSILVPAGTSLRLTDENAATWYAW